VQRLTCLSAMEAVTMTASAVTFVARRGDPFSEMRGVADGGPGGGHRRRGVRHGGYRLVGSVAVQLVRAG